MSVRRYVRRYVLPARLGWRRYVSLLLRYGMYLSRLASAEITSHRLLSDLLIDCVSLTRSPSADLRHQDPRYLRVYLRVYLRHTLGSTLGSTLGRTNTRNARQPFGHGS
jgi:hypothetical protein